MSPEARRFFGCIVPLTLALFGCGTMVVLFFAGRAVAQVRTVEDGAMAPLLQEGWEATVFYSLAWAEAPRAGIVAEIMGPEGPVFRRLVAGPGDTVEIVDGALQVNGHPSDPAEHGRGTMEDFGPLVLADGEFFVLADDRAFPDSRQWGPIARELVFGSPLFFDDGGGTRSFMPGIDKDWEREPPSD